MKRPIVTGLVAATVGFASSFTVVLAGLRAVGASDAQAASGLFALCLFCALLSMGLSTRTRLPISIAWSTPGAALLASTGTVDGGYPAAVGAFCVCGLLLAGTGLSGALARLLARIPPPLASSMLAGVLLDLCLAPVHAVVDLPKLAVPVVATWALLTRFARLWAVPAALAVAIAAVVIDRPVHLGRIAPQVVLTTPTLTVGALIGVALPLYVVTMASQNIAGVGVLASLGFRVPLRPALVSTGLASAVGGFMGGHAVNLAAISAALPAGPDADPDPARRWIAGSAFGAGMGVYAIGAGLATAFVAASPPVLVEAVAGLALLGALGGALRSAMSDDHYREAATITLVVGASGVAPLHVGASFWALLAGLAYSALRGRAAAPRAAGEAGGALDAGEEDRAAEARLEGERVVER